MSEEPLRILVVDDEPGMRNGCRKILTAEGYEVETAEDGIAGLNLFRDQGNFAAALIDLKMPRMGGIELVEHIRKEDEDIAVFVITAYATIDTAVEATKRGAYNYIPKPFTPDELLLPLRNALEKRALSIEAKRLREEREKRLLEVAFERSKGRTIINCMTDGVVVINRDHQVVLRNGAAARVLPQSAGLTLPAPLEQLGCEELQQLIETTLSEDTGPVISSKEVDVGDSTYMVNASPVLEPNGNTSGAVAVLRDITALKKLETAKSMFVSMVAHEVKSPLAAIEGYLNVILSGLTQDNPEQEHDMLERALVRAAMLRNMVSELLNVTAMQTGNFVLKRTPVALAESLEQTVDLLQERAAEKKQNLTLSIPDAVRELKVLADPDAMSMVFKNLVENAIKYTPDEGTIEVAVSHDGVYYRVSVKDNGIGLTEDEQKRVFDEFFRAKNDYTSRVAGTGLGMSLVKRLVDMHNGRIAVQSTRGQGSDFVVSLPTAE